MKNSNALLFLNKLFPNLIIAFFLVLNIKVNAQDKTINTNPENAVTRPVLKKHSVMIVPFENRMYLSEIDHLINKETKLNAKQIKATMRDGVNEQLYKKLKLKFNVIDLLDDTLKTKKDLADIYQYLTYQYQKTPNQDNYKAPLKEKDTKTINKGQVTVESTSDERFMNAKLKNATLVPYLHNKYKTDLFLFINELDIKALNGSPADFNANLNRKIIIHYTVYTVDAKEINSGIAEVDLPVNVNSTTKITANYFSQLATIITTRIDKALTSKVN